MLSTGAAFSGSSQGVPHPAKDVVGMTRKEGDRGHSGPSSGGTGWEDTVRPLSMVTVSLKAAQSAEVAAGP